jgi:hypothetical protein
MPTCNECLNTQFENTSFDNEGNYIDLGFTGLKCTNCNNVVIKKNRKSNKFYQVNSYWWAGTEGLEKANTIKPFKRLTENKVKQISDLGNAYLVLMEGDVTKYYVVYWFEKGSYELQEKTEDEIYS